MTALEDRLATTRIQLERMKAALAALRRDVLPESPELFAIMAQGPMEDVRRLRAEIDECIGAAEGEVTTETGVVREIDLDGPSLTLRQRPDDSAELRCCLPTELLEEARRALGQQVAIRGVLVRDRHTGDRYLEVRAVGLQTTHGAQQEELQPGAASSPSSS